MLNAQKTNKKFVIIAKKFDIIAKMLENPIKSRYTKSVAKLHDLAGNECTVGAYGRNVHAAQNQVYMTKGDLMI